LERQWRSRTQPDSFFVRGKVRRNTEAYARDRGVNTITEEVLYDAKAHFSR
jgi:light-independent protochlorophyllide reductase subunit B